MPMTQPRYTAHLNLPNMVATKNIDDSKEAKNSKGLMEKIKSYTGGKLHMIIQWNEKRVVHKENERNSQPS